MNENDETNKQTNKKTVARRFPAPALRHAARAGRAPQRPPGGATGHGRLRRPAHLQIDPVRTT